MGRKSKSGNLYVYMNGKLVGILSRESYGKLKFIYEKSWLTVEESRPISLSMPLRELPYSGETVFNFFDNLLPDSDLIRKRIQARFHINENNCFDLLSKIGSDCVGALQLLEQPTFIDIQKIEAERLDDKRISKLLKEYKTAPLGMEENSKFRISIAGAQEKTALLWYKDQWHLPVGATPTTHIIKLPIGHIVHSNIDLSDSCENEWLCLKILKAFGLPVNNADIVLFEDVKTLVVERFDRKLSQDKNWIIRLPQEDFCQALGFASALKYESDGGPGIYQVMNVLKGAWNATVDREQFMKSVVLFWFMGAIDGHAKNFSIIIEQGGNYHLTPLYDVISAFPFYLPQDKKLKMAMSVKGKSRHYAWREIQVRHWLEMAKLCQFPEDRMKTILEEICDKINEVIASVERILKPDFPVATASAIFQGMRHVRNKCSI